MRACVRATPTPSVWEVGVKVDRTSSCNSERQQAKEKAPRVTSLGAGLNTLRKGVIKLLAVFLAFVDCHIIMGAYLNNYILSQFKSNTSFLLVLE